MSYKWPNNWPICGKWNSDWMIIDSASWRTACFENLVSLPSKQVDDNSDRAEDENAEIWFARQTTHSGGSRINERQDPWPMGSWWTSWREPQYISLQDEKAGNSSSKTKNSDSKELWCFRPINYSFLWCYIRLSHKNEPHPNLALLAKPATSAKVVDIIRAPPFKFQKF